MPVLGHDPNTNDNHLVDEADMYTDLNTNQISIVPDVEETQQMLVNNINSFCCPNDIDSIATNIIDIQESLDADISKARRSLVEEKMRYQDLKSSFNSMKEFNNLFESFNDYTVILSGSFDFQKNLTIRIFERILDTDFTNALARYDFKKCAEILWIAFGECSIIEIAKIAVDASKEIIKFLAKLLESLCNKMTNAIDKDPSKFKSFNRTQVQGISGAISFALIVISCSVVSNPELDNVQICALTFTTIISLTFDWIISVPVNAFIGKIVEGWTDLKNTDEPILTKIGKIGKVTLEEFPLISPLVNWVRPKVPVSTPEPPIIHEIDDVFMCSVYFEPLIDPVSLRGYVYERHVITKWLKFEKRHPITQEYASINHLTEVPTEYREAFDSYMNRLRAQEVQRRRNTAAIEIQRIFRGWLCRKIKKMNRIF